MKLHNDTKLFENVTYSQAIKVLSIIAGSSLFD